jgi:thioredoxin reductase (NADPH)
MSQSRSVRVAIVGSGPAGLTAAIYAARALLKPVMVAGLEPGGQLTITTDVENYPGFAEVIQGPWLMEQMRRQAEHVGTEFLDDLVADVDLSQRPFRIRLDSGAELLAETLIIATGAKAKWLGIPSEERFRGFGVSACATCDGFFYRDKAVAVVGGGNTAVEEALFLTSFASKVTLVHRRSELRAERILQERLFAHPKIEVVWDSEIAEVLGGGTPPTVTGVRLRNLKSGYLLVEPGKTATAVKGVYAAGDVTDHVYRQAVTAAGMGCMAALEAARLLAEEDHARAHHPLAPAEAEKIGVW